MRHNHSTASLLAAAGILAAASLLRAAPATDAPAKDSSAAHQQKEPGKTSESAQAKQPPQAPEGFVIVDEQLVTLTANEPQNHFLRAKEYLAQNDPRAAAAEVRISAAYLDMQASRKGEGDQEALRSESARLRTVADDIAKGNNQPAAQPNSGKQEGAASTGQSSEQKLLNQSFAQTERVLAKHFQEEAKTELGKQKNTMAGEDLDAAASALSGSIAWSAQECSKECTSAITDARRVSAELLTPVMQDKVEGGAAHREGNESKSAVKNEAQPAAARIGAQAESGSPEAARVPADAEKVIDELGKSIESGDKIEKSKEPAQNEQHSAPDARTK